MSVIHICGPYFVQISSKSPDETRDTDSAPSEVASVSKPPQPSPEAPGHNHPPPTVTPSLPPEGQPSEKTVRVPATNTPPDKEEVGWTRPSPDTLWLGSEVS